MKTPLQRIRTGAGVLMAVSVVSIAGHRMLSPDGGYLEAVYWFVITVSTVGYGQQIDVPPHFQVFTIAVILVGIMAAGYTLGGLVQMMTEGEIERALGLRRMSREIERLSQHVVICGFGRVGSVLAESLTREKQPFVVLDDHAERIAEAEHLNYLVVSGDATEESVLQAAGIKRAKTLISALGDDAANVFLTLTADTLNPELRIIARGENPRSENKLRHAGADEVVLPAVIGARRMATMVTQPRTAELFDRVTDHKRLNVQMEELSVLGSSSLVKKTVRDAEMNHRHDLLIVAIQQADGEMVFNPNADYVFVPDDTLILMGKHEDIAEFRQRFAL